MIALPNLVQDFTIRHLTNSVLVGLIKFTLDQFRAFFTALNPAPARLAQQLGETQTSYDRLNAAYALTRESLLTGDISNLDKEGDQLYLAVKETTEAAQRMTAVPARKQAGDRNMVFLKKYRISTKENMISEWSKIQQLCEEANGSAQITADMATLGLTEVMARLTEIADQLRDTLTQRENELPSQKAMQQAREAIYPEYRALIDLLKAFAMVDADTTKYASLIQTLNRNIDYVRIHAMTGGGASGSGSESNGGQQTTDNGQQSGDDNGGQQGGGETPDPGTGGGETPVNPDPNPGTGDGGGGGADPNDPNNSED